MNIFSNKTKLVINISALLLMVTTVITGCSVIQPPSVATGTITEVTMAKNVDEDGRPIDPTTVFAADTPNLYLSFKISGFPVDTKIEVKWIYIGGDPEAEMLTGKNAVVETQTATTTKLGTGYTYTTYSRPGITGYETWPKGDYKVTFTVEGIEKASTYFKIQ